MVVANMLVGNNEDVAALEITHSGPTVFFHRPAVVALCGAAMDVTVDGIEVTMWTRLPIPKGAELVIGAAKGAGCRAYLAVSGGLPGV